MTTYTSKLDFFETQRGIELVKGFFQRNFRNELNLIRVTAPKFVRVGTGIQDDLAGTCNSVSFIPREIHSSLELVHSLAKWKRNAIKKYNIPFGTGIYTDMDAVRQDEVLDDIHSLYVDQFDWEKEITKEQYNLDFLKDIVKHIYKVLVRTEEEINDVFPTLIKKLPTEITFIHSEELFDEYPNMTPKEREFEITKKHKAVFIIGIGHKLRDGSVHDLRAFDYDNWSINTGEISKKLYIEKEGKRKKNKKATEDEEKVEMEEFTLVDEFHGLNGDILVWDPVRQDVLELSSMGIRVDKEALLLQFNLETIRRNILREKSPKTTIRRDDVLFTDFHKEIINETMPLTIGGGIGQSRISMFFLEKIHIGEVQASEWSSDVIADCKNRNIKLL